MSKLSVCIPTKEQRQRAIDWISDEIQGHILTGGKEGFKERMESLQNVLKVANASIVVREEG